MTATDEDRLVVAMKNAEAIAQTLVHHGKCMEELEEKLIKATNMVQTLAAEVQNLKTLYHQSLVSKYGTGPTSND